MDYEYWTARSDAELEREDFGRLNLLAAVGLPGSEGLDVDGYCRRLDDWAAQVAAYTRRMQSRYEAAPEECGGTPGRFRMMALATYLQRYLGVRYDPACMTGDLDYTDSRPWFIHGVMDGRGGTCMSMPVLYLAVGRRLGYPLYFCEAFEHSFLRWEEPGGERFNIECTCVGFRDVDDEHFRHRPRRIPRAMLAQDFLLKNHTPRQFLAVCLLLRHACLQDHLCLSRSLEAAKYASDLHPRHPNYTGHWAVATLIYEALAPLLPQLGRGDIPKSVQITFDRQAAPWRRRCRPFAERTMKRILKLHRRRLASTVDDRPRPRGGVVGSYKSP